jgi:hypothetical protein
VRSGIVARGRLLGESEQLVARFQELVTAPSPDADQLCRSAQRTYSPGDEGDSGRARGACARVALLASWATAARRTAPRTAAPRPDRRLLGPNVRDLAPGRPDPALRRPARRQSSSSSSERNDGLHDRPERLAGGERGLLSLAFAPDYATSGLFYVYYTRTGDGAIQVDEFP